MSDNSKDEAEQSPEQQIVDLKRQVSLLSAQLQAAINQRNAFANDTVIMAGEIAILRAEK